MRSDRIRSDTSISVIAIDETRLKLTKPDVRAANPTFPNRMRHELTQVAADGCDKQKRDARQTRPLYRGPNPDRAGIGERPGKREFDAGARARPDTLTYPQTMLSGPVCTALYSVVSVFASRTGAA
jgi:hypothetical protein